MRVLVLGDGLLGSEIVKQTSWNYISRRKDNIDFTDISSYIKYLSNCDVIINCIAYTQTYSDDKDRMWSVNYKGIADLVDICNQKKLKLVHMSTDYVYANSESNASEDDVPVHSENWYSYTKLLSDGYVQLRSNDYLLIRTSFKRRPFPFEGGWIVQLGNIDYSDTISKLIIELIRKECSGLYNVGTETKTLFDLGKQTKPDIMPLFKLVHKTTPKDVTMDISKFKKKLQIT